MNVQTSGNHLIAVIFLFIASTFGLLLGLVKTDTKFFFNAIDDGVAATIDGAEIQKVDYERAVSLFERGSREKASRSDKEMILDRLIDEELLFQYAIDRDLLRRDMNVRRTILQAVIGGLEAGDLLSGQDHSEYAVIRFEDYLGQLRETADISLDTNR